MSTKVKVVNPVWTAQRAACSSAYRNTANRKLGDLTVKELQQVQACQTLGMYPPH